MAGTSSAKTCFARLPATKTRFALLPGHDEECPSTARQSAPHFHFNPCPSVRRAPRLLEEFVDQTLADAVRDVLVDRLHRLAHRGVLLRRQRDDLALAALLDLGERVVVFFLRLVVAESRGFLHRLFAI